MTPEEYKIKLEEYKNITLSVYNTPNGKEFFKLLEQISGIYATNTGLTDNQLREQEGKRQLYAFFAQFIEK